MGIGDVVGIGKALGDSTRVRTLLALAGGELCLCQIVSLFGSAPSTLSRHMNVLVDAGLVERRKKGRWHYFRLAGSKAPSEVRRIVSWAVRASGEDARAGKDRARLEKILRKDPEEVSACYRR